MPAEAPERVCGLRHPFEQSNEEGHACKIRPVICDEAQHLLPLIGLFWQHLLTLNHEDPASPAGFLFALPVN